MKIIRKLSLRLILFQCLAIHLFGNSFFRFYYFQNADLWDCLLKNYPESFSLCLEAYPDITPGELMSEPIYYMLYGLLFGLTMVSIVNAITKKTALNTLLIAILYVGLFLGGAFSGRYLDSWILSLGQLFSKKIGIANLIAFGISFMTASILVWLSVKGGSFKKDVS